MDSSANGCNGDTYGWGGHCDNDLLIWFQDRMGRACQSRWLVNNWRVKYGQLGTNGDDAFDSHEWDWFDWREAGCIKEDGLDVPNKVKMNF